uniref:Uncharacterized protein n=1 Tax=Oryza nivara TaxID=4536 RepID=A0A0E0FFK5_ORYNI
MATMEEITNSSKAMMRMKLLVDSKAQRVLYAEEAGKDVVDFLSSLLTLPVATVVKLLSKDSTDHAAGMRRQDDFAGEARATVELELEQQHNCTSSGSSGGEAAAVATYTIMDDIKVAAMSATVLLKSGSVNDINLPPGEDRADRLH